MLSQNDLGFPLEKHIYLCPKTQIFRTRCFLCEIGEDLSPSQCTNVTCLPYSIRQRYDMSYDNVKKRFHFVRTRTYFLHLTLLIIQGL